MKRYILAIILFSCSVCAENKFINHYVFTWGERYPAIVEKYLWNSIDNPDAAYILGNLYLSGTFFKKDLRNADLFITMAANKKLPEAINSVGDGYYSGDIRQKNVEMALMYYKSAARLGFGPAQFNAGIVLLRTAKTKNDLVSAIFYLDKACKNSNLDESITAAARRYKLDAERKLKSYS